jgi:hypothetical protein
MNTIVTISDDNQKRLRQCAMALFAVGHWPSHRMSNEVAEKLLAIMEPEVKRVNEVLIGVESRGWVD